MEAKTVKVDELTPESKRVNIVVKVLEIGEEKEVSSRTGGSRALAEALVGDETASVLMTLWEDQISQVGEGDVLQIDNGFMSLVRGHLRLNVGRYGSMSTVDEDLEVNEELNISDREYEQARRPGGDYGGGGRGGRGGRGSGGGGYRGGGRGDDRRRR